MPCPSPSLAWGIVPCLAWRCAQGKVSWHSCPEPNFSCPRLVWGENSLNSTWFWET